MTVVINVRQTQAVGAVNSQVIRFTVRSMIKDSANLSGRMGDRVVSSSEKYIVR